MDAASFVLIMLLRMNSEPSPHARPRDHPGFSSEFPTARECGSYARFFHYSISSARSPLDKGRDLSLRSQTRGRGLHLAAGTGDPDRVALIKWTLGLDANDLCRHLNRDDTHQRREGREGNRLVCGYGRLRDRAHKRRPSGPHRKLYCLWDDELLRPFHRWHSLSPTDARGGLDEERDQSVPVMDTTLATVLLVIMSVVCFLTWVPTQGEEGWEKQTAIAGALATGIFFGFFVGEIASEIAPASAVIIRWILGAGDLAGSSAPSSSG